MLENINNIFNKIKNIQNIPNKLNSYKPEVVKEFDNMYKEALSINVNKKEYNKTNNSHPYLKKDPVLKETKKIIPIKDKKTMIDDAIIKASKKYKISEDLIRAVITVESNYDQYGVSKAGAMGLMQLMPRTSLELGVEKPFDIYENVDGGTRYLKLMLNRYKGDLEKALAAYNAGPHKVDKANGIPNIQETKNYVQSIKKLLFE
ncbi:MAG: lytic transglycosylase domain-containing protein [Spirochaetes bacterium]|nr:lytic transglycosylase domain-containing protein [Spirochaetota bacterium]